MHISALISKSSDSRSEFDFLFASPIKQLHSEKVPSSHFCKSIDEEIQNTPCFAVGHINYPESANLQNLTHLSNCIIYLYNWQIKVDAINQTVTFNVFNPNQETEDLYQLLLNIDQQALNKNNTCALTEPFAPAINKAEYQKQFEQIQKHIQSGDVYQINLTQPFQASFKGRVLDVFIQILQSVEAPYCAYIEQDKQTICSFSPEEFISIDDGIIKTSPIKGTIARSQNTAEDQKRIKQLENSTKDKAEHIMIVDLLRNDLGKICESGSISVEKLLSIESFANVHHLVSTISGKLKQGTTTLEALVSCFPGGSITGAPKIKAMEIIHQLESYNRQVYCGSIFYIEPNGKLLSNIPIRTIVAEIVAETEEAEEKNHLTCWSGGGIVADSNCEAEYQEAIDKINHLFKALQ